MATQKEYALLFKLQAELGSNFSKTMSSATAATKALQNSLSDLNSTSSKISNFQDQCTALEKQQDTLSQLTKEYQDLQKQMDESGDESGKLATEMEKLESKIEKTTDSIAKKEAKLDSLGNELREAGVDTNNLAEENDRLTASYDKLRESQEKLASISAAQQSNNEAIAKTQSQLTTAVGVTAAAGASMYAFAVKPTMEYEAQMSVVQSITSASAEELAVLSDKAKEMGQTTAFSATESAEAMEYLGMAGWSVQQTVDGLSGVLALAAASGEDLGNTADIVSNGLSAFGLEVTESERYADLLAQASRSANTDVALMGETFEKVGSLAGTLGYSVEDLALATTLMASTGLNGSEAGTQLKSAIANLASPTNAMAIAMNQCNISMTNADGTMKPLKELIDDMRGSFSELSEAEQASVAATLFGKEAMAGMLTIINATDEEYVRLTEAINNSTGAAQEMADIRLNNLDGDMQLLASATESLQLALGEVLTPTIRELTQKATETMVSMSQWASENPELLATIIKIGASLAALVISILAVKLVVLKVWSAILAVRKAIELAKLGITGFTKVASLASKGFTTLKTVLSAVKTAVTLLGTGIKTVFAFLAANPIVAFIAAIVAIGTAIYYVCTHLEDVRAFIEKTFGSEALAYFDGFVALVKWVGEVISTAFENVMLMCTDMGERICSGIASAIGFIQSFGEFLTTSFVFVWTTARDFVSESWEAIKLFVSSGVETVIGFLSGILSFVTSVFTTSWSAAWLVVQNLFGGVIDVIGIYVETGIDDFQGLITFLTGVFTGNWQQAWEGIKTIFSGVFEGIRTICSSVMNSIVNAVNTVIKGLNGLSIPDWVPGLGGMGINIPLIPQFAKGTNYTPDTFIAGEAGAELITNGAGRKVFTAAQTGEIFNNLNKAQKVAENVQGVSTVVGVAPELLQAMSVAQQTKRQTLGDLPNDDDPPPPPLGGGDGGSGGDGGITIIIHSNPVFNMGSGGDSKEIEAMLALYMAKLKEEIYQELEAAQADKKRRAYD